MVGFMVRYWKHLVVTAVLAVVLLLLGIANVLAAPDIKNFVMAGTILTVVV